MSVFGGDSWAREAHYRKRRLDHVVVETLDPSSYKKLSSGKYACLVCPHNPILDTPLMLSMHCKVSRHLAAESRLKEEELKRKDEINKRLALSGSLVSSHDSTAINKKLKFASRPLIEQTKKATSEFFCSKTPQQKPETKNPDVKLSGQLVNNVATTIPSPSITPSYGSVVQQFDYREYRERELKFIEAGWKRDCHGRWFKDENVEFDSDEEDPNICLSKKLQ